MMFRLLLAAVAAHLAASQCHPGFVRYENSCYYVVATRLTWFNAGQYCTTILPKNLDVQLVSIESAQEDFFVLQQINSDNDARSRDVWMSATQIDKNRGWVWAATQGSVSYTNWAGGRPSTSGKCAYFSYWDNHQWYNTDCYDRKSFVCEYNLFTTDEQKKTEEDFGRQCPVGFYQYGKSCFYFIPSSLSWFQAEQYCTMLVPKTYYVHLASIESAGEMNFIADRLRADSLLRGRQFWTSGNYMDPKIGWHWASNQRSLSYQNWAPGEPNYSGKCLQLWYDMGYQWDDAGCYNIPGSHGFICEYEMA